MATTDHQAFPQPSDPSVSIWRYLDFTKFCSLLSTSGLWFAAADRLGDVHEGAVPTDHVALRWQQAAGHFEALKDKVQDRKAFFESLVRVEKARHRVGEASRKSFFVSCWYASDVESAAMWKLYAQTNEAVAIRSTYSDLVDCLSDDDIFVGKVRYIDYSRDTFPHNNVFAPFMHKRLSFQHEREVRAIRAIFPSGGGVVSHEEFISAQPPGLLEQVDLQRLVRGVYVAPDSPRWFRPLVETMCSTFGLHVPVQQSGLAEKPLF